jgi:hypothetical protein
VLLIILFLSGSRTFAQTNAKLELSLIGPELQAPTGQVTELKMEILNGGPGDVSLVRGEVYLDEDLTSNWQLILSESLGDFHLNYLESAIWAFKLPMPSKVQAPNATNGIPQVDLFIRITFVNPHNMQLTSNGHFSLSVPGAVIRQVTNWTWFVITAVAATLTLCILLFWRKAKRPKRMNS